MEKEFALHSTNSDYAIEGLFALLGEASGASFFVWDTSGANNYFSPALLELANLQGNSVNSVEELFENVIHPEDWKKTQKALKALNSGYSKALDMDVRFLKQGEFENQWMHLRVRVTNNPAGQHKLVVGSVNQITTFTDTDTVTGLPTHLKLMKDLSESFQMGQSGYLVMLDIDDFKAVNNRHGRRFGNRLLRLFTAELEQAAGGGGVVYRLEADRFAVHLPEKNQMAVSRLFMRVQQSFMNASRQIMSGVFCTISAGAAAYPADSNDVTQFYQFVDSSLATAKAAGKDTMVFFSRDDYEQYLQSLATREDLQRCIKNNFEGFEVHYQPQVCVNTGSVMGAEALLRWTSKERGKIPPDVFIPLMERYGLICEVGRWVIKVALAQCKKWRELMPEFCMSINISYIQLEKDDIAGYILEILREYKLPGSSVVLELTESEQLHNYNFHNETLAYLKRIGVNVAIDDFGTGYSSLGYFKQLNVHQVKIDRCFISRIQESSYDYNLIQFIIELAHSIGVEVCVEGVETEDELFALLPLAPGVAQGFHFGRAVEPEVFEARFLSGKESINQQLKQKAAEVNAAKKSTKNSFPGQRDIEKLLDEIEEVVYISDVNNNELLYLNRLGRSMLNVDAYEGMKCYEILHGASVQCEFCPKHKLSKECFHEWESTGGRFTGKVTVKDKLINWGKRTACLSTTMELTEKTNLAREARQMLEMEKTIVACVRAMFEARNFNEAISMVLDIVGEHYKADRAYIFELVNEGRHTNNTYEWCRADITPRMKEMQELPFSPEEWRWHADLAENKPVVIKGQGLEGREKEAMDEFKVHGVILAPLYMSGGLTGYIGVDNPRGLESNASLLTSLSYFVAGKIAERKLNEKLEYLSYVDSLTETRNRNGYLCDIEQISHKVLHSLGVVFIDINGLKEYNDINGHDAGDEMIRAVSAASMQAFKGHYVYRIGGDEFVALCPDIAKEKLNSSVDMLQQAIRQRGYSISVGSVWADEDINIIDLIHKADTEMYTDKAAFYNEQQQAERRSYARQAGK